MANCRENAATSSVAHPGHGGSIPRPLCGPRDACPSRLPAVRLLPPQHPMQSKSLRATALLSLSLGVLTTGSCLAQASATALPSQSDPNKNNDDVGGLPTFLLKVPGGNVQMGMPVETFVEACSQAVYPFNPKFAYRDAAKKFATAMRRSSSMIGRKPVAVDTFFLGKWPVKNSEYQVFVDKMRAAQIDVRPPLHWWREGCPKDFEKHLPKIRKAFPKDPRGALYYWERHGHTLPYKTQDEKGKSIADHPVVFVSWRDANAFAASIGMRLPTEKELSRAMRGDGTRTWPGDANTPDVYNGKMLELLGMAKSTDLHTKPVGTVAGAVGPYGHLDMFGQVWQLVGDLGFGPIHDMPSFLKSWKQIEKHKTARILDRKPPFSVSKALAKGGSYLSYGEPVQLMLDTRAPLETSDALESVGFRLAKSIAPGYDFLYSLQRVEFDTGAFKNDQALALDRLVGAERYTLAANGFPSDYEAIAFAPVNWLVDATKVKSAKLKTTVAATQTRPMLIGALATTAKFENGTKQGLYSVFYRQAGIPRELLDAVKTGHKELVKARKAAEKKAKMEAKAGIKKKDKKDDKKKKKQAPARKWRMVTKKYGLKDEDVISPGGKNGNLGYVYIDGVKVATDRDAFLLSTRGKVVSYLAGTKKKPVKGNPTPSTLTIEAGQEGKSLAKMHFGIPLTSKDAVRNRNIVVFDLHALLDQAAPSADKPWRLPQPASAAPAKKKK